MELTCPKCNSEMETGWVLDKGHLSEFQTNWVPGKPKNTLFSFFTGGKSRTGKVVRPIESYRCLECGYLEFYAVKEDPLQ